MVLLGVLVVARWLLCRCWLLWVVAMQLLGGYSAVAGCYGLLL